jgi:ATP-binding cassette, sub-family E, member 1
MKPQYVDHLPKQLAKSGTVTTQKVKELLEAKSERGEEIFKEVIEMLDLEPVMDRELSQLSGGELQRFAIGLSCVQKADM